MRESDSSFILCNVSSDPFSIPSCEDFQDDKEKEKSKIPKFKESALTKVDLKFPGPSTSYVFKGCCPKKGKLKLAPVQRASTPIPKRSTIGQMTVQAAAGIDINRSWKENRQYKPAIFPFAFKTSAGFKINNANLPSDSLLEFFNALFPSAIMERIRQETNRKFFELIIDNRVPLESIMEIKTRDVYVFMGLTMLMGHLKKDEVAEYWSTDSLVCTPIFEQVMPKDRYELILNCLHFSNNAITIPGDRFSKIRDILNLMTTANKDVFTPYERLTIDESLVPFKGKLDILPVKRGRVGIKVFLLCDCQTGFVINYLPYMGKYTEIKFENLKDHIGFAGQVVLTLLQPYLGKGYKIFLDEWYTSPALAEVLLHNKTNMCGTVKPNRGGMPQEELPELSKEEMHWLCSEKLLYSRWYDQSEVRILSTMHGEKEVGVIRRHKKEILIPKGVIDYNKNMSSVNLREIEFSANEIKSKSAKWYIKLFFHFLDVQVRNSYILYQGICKNQDMTLQEFRLELVREILKKYGETEEQNVVPLQSISTGFLESQSNIELTPETLGSPDQLEYEWKSAGSIRFDLPDEERVEESKESVKVGLELIEEESSKESLKFESATLIPSDLNEDDMLTESQERIKMKSRSSLKLQQLESEWDSKTSQKSRLPEVLAESNDPLRYHSTASLRSRLLRPSFTSGIIEEEPEKEESEKEQYEKESRESVKIPSLSSFKSRLLGEEFQKESKVSVDFKSTPSLKSRLLQEESEKESKGSINFKSTPSLKSRLLEEETEKESKESVKIPSLGSLKSRIEDFEKESKASVNNKLNSTLKSRILQEEPEKESKESVKIPSLGSLKSRLLGEDFEKKSKAAVDNKSSSTLKSRILQEESGKESKASFQIKSLASFKSKLMEVESEKETEESAKVKTTPSLKSKLMEIESGEETKESKFKSEASLKSKRSGLNEQNAFTESKEYFRSRPKSALKYESEGNEESGISEGEIAAEDEENLEPRSTDWLNLESRTSLLNEAFANPSNVDPDSEAMEDLELRLMDNMEPGLLDDFEAAMYGKKDSKYNEGFESASSEYLDRDLHVEESGSDLNEYLGSSEFSEDLEDFKKDMKEDMKREPKTSITKSKENISRRNKTCPAHAPPSKPKGTISRKPTKYSKTRMVLQTNYFCNCSHPHPPHPPDSKQN